MNMTVECQVDVMRLSLKDIDVSTVERVSVVVGG